MEVSDTRSASRDHDSPAPLARRTVARPKSRSRRSTAILATVALAATFALQACSSPTRLSAVPKEKEAEAVIGGMTGIRYWRQDDLAMLTQDGMESFRREAAHRAAEGLTGPLPPAVFLAISGGGEDGAFGAGLLNGWTAAGDRPEFKLVTGISTGALSAPFAFLGPDYDDQLKSVYTEVKSKDILVPRGVLAAIFDDAVADNAPLRALVASYVNEEMLAAIAREHEKGRILLIGTTNIDSRRPVIWNIGKIAASGDPEALELVRSILVASAAIPGAFPPTMIDVHVDGERYQEMHVDGGASAQVFVYPPQLHVGDVAKSQGAVRERKMYVIRNGRLDPDWADTKRETLPIVGRAISSLIQNQGIGDLFRIYSTAERDGVDFNLALIPSTFNEPLTEPFEQGYMRKLYQLGFDMAKAGYPWRKLPPGF